MENYTKDWYLENDLASYEGYLVTEQNAPLVARSSSRFAISMLFGDP